MGHFQQQINLWGSELTQAGVSDIPAMAEGDRLEDIKHKTQHLMMLVARLQVRTTEPQPIHQIKWAPVPNHCHTLFRPGAG